MDQFIILKNLSNSLRPDIEVNDVGVIQTRGKNYCNILFIRLDKIYRVPLPDVLLIDLSKVGDEFPQKICDRCYKLLPTGENFSNNRIKKGGKITKRPSCKNCRKIIEGKPIDSRIKTSWENKKPHMSLFACPICQKKSIAGLTKIVLDHNHTSGKVRGYICESCNTGLGRFKDNIQLLSYAIEWLEKSEDKSQ